MKIGAEEKKKVMVMAALVATLVAVAVYNFGGLFGGTSAPTAAADPAVPPKKVVAAGGVPDPSQDPRLRLDILDASRSVKYQPGRDIFHMYEPPPKPIAEVRATPTPLPPPPTPTPLPPIPLKYYGFASKPGETRRVFLANEKEQISVAAQGDIVDRRYRLVEIQTNSVVMEDMLTNNRQPIPLTPRPLAQR